MSLSKVMCDEDDIAQLQSDIDVIFSGLTELSYKVISFSVGKC